MQCSERYTDTSQFFSIFSLIKNLDFPFFFTYKIADLRKTRSKKKIDVTV